MYLSSFTGQFHPGCHVALVFELLVENVLETAEYVWSEDYCFLCLLFVWPNLRRFNILFYFTSSLHRNHHQNSHSPHQTTACFWMTLFSKIYALQKVLYGRMPSPYLIHLILIVCFKLSKLGRHVSAKNSFLISIFKCSKQSHFLLHICFGFSFISPRSIRSLSSRNTSSLIVSSPPSLKFLIFSSPLWR